MKIGKYELKNNLVLAPMAGITDMPFRKLCNRFCAGLTVSEMIDCNPQLRYRQDTFLRLKFSKDESPRCVQIAGNNAKNMAEMAKFCVDHSAEIIDINMGCPAKKICGKKSGASLMKDETLAAKIISAVVNSVEVPVTLKIRTGWNVENKNAMKIAKIAEQSGIQAITIHGRTRADGYHVPAEYDTVKLIKDSLKIPVIVNGDINSQGKLLKVLEYTKADGAMIGRAAFGKPWIFAELLGEKILIDLFEVMIEHIQMLHEFYGKTRGVLMARKHAIMYLQNNKPELRQKFNSLQTPADQINLINSWKHL